MKVGLLFCALLLTGCALSETELKTEAKVRFDKVYPVELAHYEYEERLQTFYDAEEILPEHLGRLYEGEFPNGETSPNKLRIHWTNARALAQAEVELQKDILGWAGADVSPRPILVNDRDDKFYRYYEYRVLKGGKEVGAVRIPAYRRTENFATAEVHQYNGDASQYTLKPTGWGANMAKNIVTQKENKAYHRIVEQTDSVLTENVLYNILYRMYNDTELSKNLTDFSSQVAYDILLREFSKHGAAMDGTKKRISDSDRNRIFEATALNNTTDLQAKLMETKSLLYKLESLSILMPYATNKVKDMMYEMSLMHFSMGIKTSYFNMVYDAENTTFRKYLKTIYWSTIEKNLNGQLNENILIFKWDILNELSKQDVMPVIEYPNFKDYPQKVDNNPLSTEYSFANYQLIEDNKHVSYLEAHTGFDMPHGIKTSLHLPISNSRESEFNFSKSSVAKMNSRSGNDISLKILESVLDGLLGHEVMGDAETLMKGVDGVLKHLGGMASIFFWDVCDDQGRLDFAAFGNGTPNLNPFGIFGYVAETVLTLGFNIIADLASIKNDVNLINRDLNNLMVSLDNRLKDLGLKNGLGTLADSIDWIISKVPLPDNVEQGLSYLNDVFRHYANGGRDYVKNTFKLAFDQWVVWVIPIFIFPTWVHYTEKWGAIPEWQYRLGLPVVWTFNINRIAPKRPAELTAPTPPAPPLFPELEFLPEFLKPYGFDWLRVNDWLTTNKIYNISEAGVSEVYKNLTDKDVGDIVETFMDEFYNLYSGKTPVYINKLQAQTLITNITVLTNSPDVVVTNTNIVDNIISNPSEAEIQDQNKYNVNALRLEINDKYNIQLSTYK